MRTFIATGISTPDLLDLLEELRSIDADTKVVKPEHLHLTLKFLGEIPEIKVDELQKALTDCLSSFEAFETTLKGVGVFPNKKRMRVIWVGFDKNGKNFIDMNNAVESALEKIGFPREGRFHPHLTLARIRTARGKEKLIDFLEKNEAKEFGAARVEKVEIMKSTLTPKGPIYLSLKQVRLRRSK